MSRNVGFIDKDEESDDEPQSHPVRMRNYRDTFAVTNTPRHEDDMDDIYVKSMCQWEPPAHVTRGIVSQGEPGINRTRLWNDDDESEVTHEKQGEVSIIPNMNRESTPDSVINTGRMMVGINRSDRSAFEVNRSNLQGYTTQGNGRNPGAVSTRNYLRDMNKYEDSSRNGQAGTIEMRPIGVDQVDMREKKNTDDDIKNERCDILPKLLILVIAIMLLIAGIVALVVKFKDNSDKADRDNLLGKILPNTITYDECEDISVSLGEEFNFTCKFDLNHEYRKELKRFRRAKVEPENMIIDESRTKFSTESSVEPQTNILTIIFESDWEARCSTRGRYKLYLKDNDDEVLHVAHVNIYIKPSMVNTTFVQRLDKCPATGDSNVTSYFEATCFVREDCNSYEPAIVGTLFKRVESLNHLMKCQRQFTDDDGFSIQCKANISEGLVNRYNEIQCRMNSDRNKQVKSFSLPKCQPNPTCTKVTFYQPYPFNCSAKSNHIENIKNATCNFEALKNCLQPGQQIFTMNKEIDGSLICRKSPTSVPVCRLSWCSDYRYVVKYLSPGNAICGSGFDEQEYTPKANTSTQIPPTSAKK